MGGVARRRRKVTVRIGVPLQTHKKRRKNCSYMSKNLLQIYSQKVLTFANSFVIIHTDEAKEGAHRGKPYILLRKGIEQRPES